MFSENKAYSNVRGIGMFLFCINMDVMYCVWILASSGGILLNVNECIPKQMEQYKTENTKLEKDLITLTSYTNAEWAGK